MVDQEILSEFEVETKALITELQAIIDKIMDRADQKFPVQEFSDFAQIIDRIMGSVNTIVAMDVELSYLKPLGVLAEICKKTGYQAARTNALAIVPIITSFWEDVLEYFQEILDHSSSVAEVQDAKMAFAGILEKRLKWLAEQMTKFSGGKVDTLMTQSEIDALIGTFKGNN